MEEKSLVAIGQTVIGDSEVNSVNARELHGFLEIGKDFSTWIKDRVEQYHFIENHDFIVLPNLVEQTCNSGRGGHNKIEYHISMDMAKELSMVERNDKGKQARQYFIRCEKEFIKISSGKSPKKLKEKAVSLNVLSRETKAAIALANLYGIAGNQALLSANKAVNTMYGINGLALLEIQGLENKSKVQYFTPSVIGNMIDLSAVKLNQKLKDIGLQEEERDHRNRLVWNVTSKGKQYCEIVDTGKKHNNGSPVTQIRWSEAVLDLLDNVKPLFKTF